MTDFEAIIYDATGKEDPEAAKILREWYEARHPQQARAHRAILEAYDYGGENVGYRFHHPDDIIDKMLEILGDYIKEYGRGEE